MRIFIFILSLMISACATSPQKKLEQLRPPMSALPGPIKLRQQLTIKSPKLNQSFEAVISVNKSEMKLVALTSMGAILFSMDYDGKKLESSNPQMQKLADLVMSDILLASMSTDELKRYLPQGLSILDKVQLRTVLNRDQELVKISYVNRKAWPREFVLVRLSQGYELKVRTIEEL